MKTIKFTPEQRLEIYLIAKKEYSKDKQDIYENTAGLCYYLVSSVRNIHNINIRDHILESILPEFKAIKPKSIVKDIHPKYDAYWFSRSKTSTGRMIALNKMIKMVENKL